MQTLSRTVRPTAVAGVFYPDAPAVLAHTIDALLADARAARRGVPRGHIKALIVPHAGLVYSGAVAASAYALLSANTTAVRRVVLLGPAHRVYLREIALPSADAFATPLGEVDVDRDAVSAIASMPTVARDRDAHAHEHALEVQLPFLQRILARFTVVPLVVGDVAPDAVAAVLDRLWGDDETLLVFSTDLSHHLPYERAHTIDASTVDAMCAGRTLSSEQACGARVLNGVSALRKLRALEPHVLDLRNSGDTAGSRADVVGYLAVAFTEGGRA
jgi:AmmeMemoRadiSam system protein B